MDLSTLTSVLSGIFGHPDFWRHASIPVVAGLVGWGTNWAAIQLTFYPVSFVGRRPYLGWQGIIPSKAEKMAAIFVDSTMSRLGTLSELFQQMQPAEVGDQIVRVMTPRLPRYADEILRRESPALWRSTPALIKERVYESLRGQFPRVVHDLMDDIGSRVEELIDFKHMITQRLVEDRGLLNRLFIESGDREFRFIIRSGLYFGFLFGLVQLLVWIVHPGWWVLPVFGILVGYLTNWIALNVIFRPLHPTAVGPWTVHGLFLKRQREVARVWSRLVSREIVTVRALVHAMMNGPHADKSEALIKRRMAPLVADAIGPLRLAAELALGRESFAELAEQVGRKSVDLSTAPFDDWRFNRDRARIVERLLRERMEDLPPAEFQDLLRPCFQEDEMKLILVGAVLGGIAGTAQWLLVFGGI
ncbi:MAG: hypothetical protein V3T72_17765 [Thermoanaerobaculia bacterium]